MDRLEERREIAARLDDAAAARELVNAMPEVIAARAKSDAADKAAKAARDEFNRVFGKHYPRDDEVQDELIEAHPDLYTLGSDDTKWIVRCAVTGLPIFEGDNVIERRTGDSEYERSFVLADAVTVDADLCLTTFRKAVADLGTEG